MQEWAFTDSRDKLLSALKEIPVSKFLFHQNTIQRFVEHDHLSEPSACLSTFVSLVSNTFCKPCLLNKTWMSDTGAVWSAES